MEDKNTRIYLIGFMGCGKSYAGRHLAEAIGWSFLDLDRQIEQDAGRPISGIFAESGESAFRTMERSALHRTGELARTIISCGGGLPCFFDNMDWMNSRGITVFLNASVELLTVRLSKDKGKRPLLKNLSGEELVAFIEGRLQERLPFYSQAGLRLDLNTGEESAWMQIQKALPVVMSKK